MSCHFWLCIGKRVFLNYSCFFEKLVPKTKQIFFLNAIPSLLFTIIHQLNNTIVTTTPGDSSDHRYGGSARKEEEEEVFIHGGGGGVCDWNGRKQMIVDVLVLSLWKTTLVMIDLATTAQTATVTAVDFDVGVTIDCPSLTKTQKKGKCGKRRNIYCRAVPDWVLYTVHTPCTDGNR